MSTKELVDKAYTNLTRHGVIDANRLDAKAIEAILAEIIGETYQAGVETGSRLKGEPRRLKKFSFDVPKLQKAARDKMLKNGLTFMQVSDASGLVVNTLKQHLGEKPPADMGLKVVISLMVFIGDFDALGFLLEEES